jgi:hypothetical protein
VGFLEEIAETARRALTGDSWYVDQQPYVLELITNPIGAALIRNSPVTMITFPLGPKQYKVGRHYRQTITPTLGGLIAEERGLLWRSIVISGSFGLAPKFGVDLSIFPEENGPPTAIYKLSGPGWTKRLLRNYFDNYAMLKANPDAAADTRLVWHDIRKDEHYVVVPELVEIDRNAGDRHQDPYTIQFTAIADAAGLTFAIPTQALGFLAGAVAVLSEINSAVNMVNSAIQEASAIVGQVRYYAQAIDSVIDNTVRIVSSAQDFLDGVTDTISVGRTFINSVVDAWEEVQALIEQVTDIPATVRANYAMAIDGLDAISAQRSAFGETYAEKSGRIEEAEKGQAGRASRTALDEASEQSPPVSASAMGRGLTSTAKALVDAGVYERRGRSFANYTGFTDYTVTAFDTLESIAAAKLGDGSLWYDIALVNGLKPPYLTSVGMPGTVKPGDKIAIPVLNTERSAAASDPDLDPLLTDFEWDEAPASKPGRPAVTFAINQATRTDFKMVSGVDNFSQALQMRTWTERGALPLNPEYGIRRVVGINRSDAEISILKLNLRENFRADPRTKLVGAIRLNATDDLVDIDVDVVPIGQETTQSVSLVVV